MADKTIKVLVMGGAGMLGHKLWQCLKNDFDAYVTLRRPLEKHPFSQLFDSKKTFSGVDVTCFESVEKVFQKVQPDVVVNCVGIIKQLKEAKNAFVSIQINALLPHQLARLCSTTGARLIHMSTDCIFNGKKENGNYKEDDPSDAEDIYGKTKFLGEVSEPHCLTVRSSIIGRELEGHYGLVDWFLSQTGKTVRGFTKAMYTGFTTQSMAGIMASMIKDFPKMSGVYQIASSPINKYELLQKLKKVFNLKITIEPFDDFYCNRALDGSRFLKETCLSLPTWDKMIADLAKESQENGGLYGL